MSVVALSIPEAGRALLAVDTVITHGTGEYSEGAKLRLLPHAGAVLAGVGSVSVGDAAFRFASRPAVNPSFDLIALGLRERLDSILSDVLASCACDPQSAAVVGGGSHVYLVGWSHAAARMRGLVFIQQPGAQHFREHDATSWWTQPHDPAYEGKQPQTADEIAARACAAVRYGKSIDPTCGFGGRLVVAEITRNCISTHVKEIP